MFGDCIITRCLRRLPARLSACTRKPFWDGLSAGAGSRWRSRRYFSVVSCLAIDKGRRNAAKALCRLWRTVSISGLHGRVLGFAGAGSQRLRAAALSHRCDLSYYIVHQTDIMIAHALRGSELAAWQEAGIVIGGNRRDLRAHLRDRPVRRVPAAAVRFEDGRRGTACDAPE